MIFKQHKNFSVLFLATYENIIEPTKEFGTFLRHGSGNFKFLFEWPNTYLNTSQNCAVKFIIWDHDILWSFFPPRWLARVKYFTVKLARAKLPANAGNFTCSSQVKRSLAQFTCVTCSLPVITGKFTCFEAASTSRRTHAHCLRAHVNLPEYHRYFTGSFTCGTYANLPATSMQNCLLLQAKIHATYRQKH